MRFFFSLLLILFIVTGTISQATAQTGADNELADFQAGREYVELPGPPLLFGPEDGKVEVLAFYRYLCNICYNLEPKINTWAKDLPSGVRLVRLPFAYNEPHIFHARIAFALENLGLGPDIHGKVFNLFQKQGKIAFNPEDLSTLAQDLNIDEEKLLEAYNSTEVKAKMEQLAKVTPAYDLAGVPSMVIDGRYSFDTGTARGPKNYLELADFLIERQRKERAKK